MSCSISASLAMHVAVARWWVVSCLSKKIVAPSQSRSWLQKSAVEAAAPQHVAPPSIVPSIHASIFLIRM